LAFRSCVPLVFLGLAAWFLWGSGSAMPVLPEPVGFDRAEIAPVPPRADVLDRPEIVVGGYVQRCSACHDLFESEELVPTDLRQHEHIVLDHGLNARCHNCHSRTDHNKLILHAGEEIAFSEVVRLCASCHGPTWRDWEKGMHGRTTGSWDAEREEQRRLGCTECHDPHAPAFPAVAPLPGPRTLRMGEQQGFAHSVPPEKTSPLMRWLEPHETDHDRSASEAAP
jgi:hypothetical protein